MHLLTHLICGIRNYFQRPPYALSRDDYFDCYLQELASCSRQAQLEVGSQGGEDGLNDHGDPLDEIKLQKVLSTLRNAV